MSPTLTFLLHKKKVIAIGLLFSLLVPAASLLKAQQKEQTFSDLNHLLINTVMDDLYPPTIASRIYVYPQIAFYECISRGEHGFSTLSSKLNGFSKLPAPPANSTIDNFIAACVSFSYVGQNLVGSEYKLEDWRKIFVDSLMKVNDTVLVKNSINYGHLVADSIISWTKKDNYLRSRGMSRFVLGKGLGNWQPTPADYAPGLEPHWNTIRPLTLITAY